MRLFWDLETNGFLEDVTTIHSLLMQDVDTGTFYSCHDHPEWSNPNENVTTLSVNEGLALLSIADERIGHNVVKYDLRVLKKLYPSLVLSGVDTDTMVLARLIHPDIKDEDSKALAAGRLNKETFKHQGRSCHGSHALAAWGHRLGTPKIEYSGEFKVWSPEMQGYGEQDIPVTKALYLYLKPHTYSQDAIRLEHEIADICADIEIGGIPFDLERAIELQATLAKQRDDIKRSLMGLFPDWEVVTKKFIAKVNLPKRSIKKGDEVIVKKTVVFNPGSREHIAKCLIEKYRWKPKEFTPTGKPQIDDEILKSLEYPEAKALADYFVVCKTLSQLAEGDGNWMKYFSEPTRAIHAAYNTMGTVTSRCSHFSPNIGQVPSIELGEDKHPIMGLKGGFGYECRQLFGSCKGYTLLGTDMSGLELRCLAHYMAHFDKGAYAELVVNGDVHTINQQAAGLPTRANAKTFIYGFLYGAGPEKIGSIVNGSISRGKALIASFLAKTPALNSLRNAVASAVGKGYIVAIDGRHVPIRKKHAALNSLLQSAGAIICKKWVVGIKRELTRLGYVYRRDYRFVAFVHDELQILVKPQYIHQVGAVCKAVAIQVGLDLNFKCPLAAEYKTGSNWAETH